MKKTISALMAGLLCASVLAGCSPKAGESKGGKNAAKPDYSAVQAEIRNDLQQLLGTEGTSVSYAVMQNGEIVLSAALGYLDGTKQTPATEETLYNIGSISKVYCAVAVLTLVDAGKIGLDEPVAPYLPEFKMQDGRYRDITPRMLLNHSSGVPGTAFTLTAQYGSYDADAHKKALEAFALSGLKADPGEYSVYCNDGFMVAELLVETLSGMKYSDYVMEKVLTPLGAVSSAYSDRDYAPGSYAVQGMREHEFWTNLGSGGISTNLADACRFGQMFLDEDQGILSAESMEEMKVPQGKSFIAADNLSVTYGLGWDNVGYAFEKYDFGGGVLAKSGATNQFASQLYVFPEYDMVCAISATMDVGGSVAEALAKIAAKVLRAQGIEVAREATAKPFEQQPLLEGFKERYDGIYGSYSSMLRVTANEDDTITVESFAGTGYTEKYAKLYYDGAAFTDESGNRIYAFTEAKDTPILMTFLEGGIYEYPTGQKLSGLGAEYGAWAARTGQMYLMGNMSANAEWLLNGVTLFLEESLPGIVIAGQSHSFYPMRILDDDSTGMMIQLSGNMGRELFTMRTKTVNGEEWLYTESYDLRPVNSLATLESGVVSINQNGDNALYMMPGGICDFVIPDSGRIIAYDVTGLPVYDSKIYADAAFDKLPSEGYIRFLGAPGAEFTVAISG